MQRMGFAKKVHRSKRTAKPAHCASNFLIDEWKFNELEKVDPLGRYRSCGRGYHNSARGTQSAVETEDHLNPRRGDSQGWRSAQGTARRQCKCDRSRRAGDCASAVGRLGI